MRGAHFVPEICTGGRDPVNDNEAMSGIRFVTDGKGRKVAVLIDLKKRRELWEDIEDVLVFRSRRRERRIPLKKVRASLIKSGGLSGR
jgi:hypothetical protein